MAQFDWATTTRGSVVYTYQKSYVEWKGGVESSHV